MGSEPTLKAPAPLYLGAPRDPSVSAEKPAPPAPSPRKAGPRVHSSSRRRHPRHAGARRLGLPSGGPGGPAAEAPAPPRGVSSALRAERLAAVRLTAVSERSRPPKAEGTLRLASLRPTHSRELRGDQWVWSGTGPGAVAAPAQGQAHGRTRLEVEELPLQSLGLEVSSHGASSWDVARRRRAYLRDAGSLPGGSTCHLCPRLVPGGQS